MDIDFYDLWKRVQISGEAIQILRQCHKKLIDLGEFADEKESKIHKEALNDIDLVIRMLRN